MDIKHILMQLEAEVRFISEIEAEMGVTIERIPIWPQVVVDQRSWHSLSGRSHWEGGGLLKVQHPV
jgi:hypothetical protein